jgi:hypothetical protein
MTASIHINDGPRTRDAWAAERDALYRRVGTDLPVAVQVDSVTVPQSQKPLRVCAGNNHHL